LTDKIKKIPVAENPAIDHDKAPGIQKPKKPAKIYDRDHGDDNKKHKEKFNLKIWIIANRAKLFAIAKAVICIISPRVSMVLNAIKISDKNNINKSDKKNIWQIIWNFFKTIFEYFTKTKIDQI
jgi:hypothetical protein